ncbi:hypothetical protein C8Q76DRAFT_697531 [Earliella scabrosa]|nr:hypothetical protein C8Q76DRAFT_697531 [Earliella scabrosa]
MYLPPAVHLVPSASTAAPVDAAKLWQSTPSGKRNPANVETTRTEAVRKAVAGAVKTTRALGESVEGSNVDDDASVDPHAVAIREHLALYHPTLTKPTSAFDPRLKPHPAPTREALSPLAPAADWDLGVVSAHEPNLARAAKAAGVKNLAVIVRDAGSSLGCSASSPYIAIEWAAKKGTLAPIHMYPTSAQASVAKGSQEPAKFLEMTRMSEQSDACISSVSRAAGRTQHLQFSLGRVSPGGSSLRPASGMKLMGGDMGMCIRTASSARKGKVNASKIHLHNPNLLDTTGNTLLLIVHLRARRLQLVPAPHRDLHSLRGQGLRSISNSSAYMYRIPEDFEITFKDLSDEVPVIAFGKRTRSSASLSLHRSCCGCMPRWQKCSTCPVPPMLSL